MCRWGRTGKERGRQGRRGGGRGVLDDVQSGEEDELRLVVCAHSDDVRLEGFDDDFAVLYNGSMSIRLNETKLRQGERDKPWQYPAQ